MLDLGFLDKNECSFIIFASYQQELADQQAPKKIRKNTELSKPELTFSWQP